jgi:hypothetical protein
MDIALLRWTGTIRVTILYPDGTREVEEFHNLITDAGRNLLADQLRTGVDGRIRYVALGDSSTAPLVSQTRLVAEKFRKATSSAERPATGQCRTLCYVAPSEATTFTTREIGWFSGTAATASVNSGTMVARVLYTRAKTDIESLLIERVDTITAA